MQYALRTTQYNNTLSMLKLIAYNSNIVNKIDKFFPDERRK